MQEPQQLAPFDLNKVQRGDTVFTLHGEARTFIAGPSPDGMVVLDNGTCWYLISPDYLRLAG